MDFGQAFPLTFGNVTIHGQKSEFAPELLQVIEKVPKNRQIGKVLMLTSDSC